LSSFILLFLLLSFQTFAADTEIGERKIDDSLTRHLKMVSVSQTDHTVSPQLEPKTVLVSTNGSRS